MSDDSRIIIRRDVRGRLVALAPFLRWDDRPEVAVVDGRITYLFHGYTTSDAYPYSASVLLGRSRVNYMREAARAAVDAFSGRVSIYAADDADPILRAWQAAYPDLFLSASRMPRGLRARLRYPRALFKAQMDVFATYHALDVTAFWTGSDAWQTALQIAGPIEKAGEVHFPNPERAVDPDERDENRRTRGGCGPHTSWPDFPATHGSASSSSPVSHRAAATTSSGTWRAGSTRTGDFD